MLKSNTDITRTTYKESTNLTIGLVFSKCDLECEYCQNRVEYNNDLHTHLEDTYQSVKKYIENYSHNTINITYNGTEMFNSRFDKHTQDTICDYFQKIDTIIRDKNIEPSYTIVTNLMANDYGLVCLNYLKYRYCVRIITSYDMVGRFTDQEEERFLHNLEKLGVDSIYTVAHKKNIEYLYNKKGLDTWNYLYNTYNIELLDYIDIGVSGYSVSETDVVEFYKWLYDYYPKIVRKYLDNVTNFYEDCSNCVEIVGKDIVYKRCNISDKYQNFVEKFGCFYCKYFGNCCRPCVCSTKDVCLYREVRNYVEKSNSYTDWSRSR